ncbi:hypothetical protein C8J57DRAFT_69489 [Mycena rebaudengoi]|nr:hypothetical protein C8J57DRAFT_69489 [Mycena rebaudengoi]
MHVPSPSAGARQSSERIVHMTTRSVVGFSSRADRVQHACCAEARPNLRRPFSIVRSSNMRLPPRPPPPQLSPRSPVPAPRASPSAPIRPCASRAPRCATVPAHSALDQQPRPCLPYIPWARIALSRGHGEPHDVSRFMRLRLTDAPMRRTVCVGGDGSISQLRGVGAACFARRAPAVRGLRTVYLRLSCVGARLHVSNECVNPPSMQARMYILIASACGRDVLIFCSGTRGTHGLF